MPRMVGGGGDEAAAMESDEVPAARLCCRASRGVPRLAHTSQGDGPYTCIHEFLYIAIMIWQSH